MAQLLVASRLGRPGGPAGPPHVRIRFLALFSFPKVPPGRLIITPNYLQKDVGITEPT